MRCLLCCREWPSPHCVDGSVKSGVEARGKRYLVVQDPAGPITGTEPKDENQMDQADLGLPEGGIPKKEKQILYACLDIFKTETALTNFHMQLN